MAIDFSKLKQKQILLKNFKKWEKNLRGEDFNEDEENLIYYYKILKKKVYVIH